MHNHTQYFTAITHKIRHDINNILYYIIHIIIYMYTYLQFRMYKITTTGRVERFTVELFTFRVIVCSG